jgi:DNA-directed RNA polymerase specialized sigma24 family protein
MTPLTPPEAITSHPKKKVMTDQEEDKQVMLMQELKEGVPDAFRMFFLRSYTDFLDFANVLIHDKISAKNVTVEAFFLLWAKHGDFDNEKAIRAFLYSTIRDNCLSYLSHLRDDPGAGKYAAEVRYSASLSTALIRELLAFADRSSLPE